MNVEYINPFLHSAVNVISTMAFIDPKPGAPYIEKTNKTKGEVTGYLGLAGSNIKGTVIISFQGKAALEIVSSMLGEEFLEINQDIEDAVGELTNMIVGGAKRVLSEKGYKFNLAIPTIVTGEEVTLNIKTKGPMITIPFTLDSGTAFSVSACFEEF